MDNKRKSCCFIGHRKIEDKETVKIKLAEIVEKLISEDVDTFIVGSRSDFNELSCEVLKEKKEKYPHIKRIFIRAEYPYIDEGYEKYLLESCEETYFSERAKNANKLVYIERNYEMIDKSDICIMFYKEDYLPPKKRNGRQSFTDYQPKSGTGMAYKYAIQKNREIINL